MKVCIKNSKTEITQEQLEVISSFIKFLQSQVPLSSDTQVVLTNNQKTTVTTGIRMPGSKIYVLTKGRMLVDILRTLSHEWVHEFQYQKLGLDDNAKIKNIGGPEENMCNILSGIFIKKFDKQNPDYNQKLYEQKIINELSPKSTGVSDVLSFLSVRPNLVKRLGFRNFEAVKHFIDAANYDDFDELREDIEKFLEEKEQYLEKEMEEIQRAVQELSRDEGLEISVKDVVEAFRNSNEVTLTDDIWSKLENTESNQVKKGEMNKVVEIAKKYDKTSPYILKKALMKDEYERPLILKFGDRYHLVAGNTRLSTAAAIGMKPQVIIAEI
jgi:hypothetical protein